MLKIFSWNVNGLRAVINKGAFQKFIKEYGPDIVCLQETKAKQGQAEIDLPEYEEIWNSAERPGYSGTAIFTKIKPLSVRNNFPTEVIFADQFGDPLTEGRVLTVEFEKFYLVNVYTPNSKNELERLPLREKKWDPEFLKYVKELEKEKPVVFCGDLNAAHEEIDIARPKTNHHSAGRCFFENSKTVKKACLKHKYKKHRRVTKWISAAMFLILKRSGRSSARNCIRCIRFRSIMNSPTRRCRTITM